MSLVGDFAYSRSKYSRKAIIGSHRQLGSLWSVRPREEAPLTLWCASYHVCHVVELFSHQSYANALILDAARWFVLICLLEGCVIDGELVFTAHCEH